MKKIIVILIVIISTLLLIIVSSVLIYKTAVSQEDEPAEIETVTAHQSAPNNISDLENDNSSKALTNTASEEAVETDIENNDYSFSQDPPQLQNLGVTFTSYPDDRSWIIAAFNRARQLDIYSVEVYKSPGINLIIINTHDPLVANEIVLMYTNDPSNLNQVTYEHIVNLDESSIAKLTQDKERSPISLSVLQPYIEDEEAINNAYITITELEEKITNETNN